jgi:predicted porin
MRKILLGTTAVAGAALLAPAAFAQAPVTTAPGNLAGGNIVGTQGVTAPSPAIAAASGLAVRIGGYFDFSAAMIYDDWDQARSRNAAGGVNNAQRRSRYDQRNDLELYIYIDGRAANGMTYGAMFEYQMDNAATGAADGTTVSLDEAWGYIGMPNLGTLQFGQQDNAASQLQVRAPSAGLVGSDGDWYDFIVNTGLFSSAYITSGINDGNDSTKVIYLSPQFAGFDFGLSYGQNSYEGERDNVPNSTSAQRDRLSLENELSAAIRYRGTFGPVGVNAGLGGMWANSGALNAAGAPLGTLRAQNVTAYTAGLTFSAYGFAVGGEFTWGQYNGSSVGRAALNPGLDDSYHWIVGATYTMGPLLIGGNFAQGEQDNGVQSSTVGGVTTFRSLADRKHTIWGVGAVYTLAPGLAVYAIYQNVNDENIPTGAPSDARYLARPANGGTAGTTLASFDGSNTRTINIGMVGIRLAF